MYPGVDRVKPRGRCGFTLVELLVVIGIIALLISILLPSLSKARLQANAVACMSNLRQIGQALQMYTIENRGSFPISGTYPDGTTVSWYGSLNKYLGAPEGVNSKIYTDKDIVRPTYDPGWFDQDNVMSYMAHQAYFSYDLTTTPVTKPYTFSKLKNATERAIIWDGPQVGNAWGDQAPGVYQCFDVAWMIGDTVNWAPNWLDWPLPDWYLATCPAPNPGPNTDPVNRAIPFPGSSSENDQQGQFRFRHLKNRQGNFLFADGHVTPINYKRFAFGGSDLRWENLWYRGM